MKNTRLILSALALLAIFFVAWAVQHFLLSDNQSSQPPFDALPSANIPTVERTNAHDFEMTDQDGNTIRLSELFDKPVVLNFWASWCPPCKDELPYFQAAYDKYGSEVQFVMLVLLADPRETPEKAMAFMADNSYTLPCYFDSLNEAAVAYGVTSIPRTYTIDTDGNFVNGMSINGRFAPGHIGAVNQASLERYITELLASV